MNEKASTSGLRSGMGILMGRAFREGVEKHRKINMRVKPKQWKPLDDLKGLTSRTQQTKLTMGPLQEVPAMVRIEEELSPCARKFRRSMRRVTVTNPRWPCV